MGITGVSCVCLVLPSGSGKTRKVLKLQMYAPALSAQGAAREDSAVILW